MTSDDTICTDGQSHEDTLMAMITAGAMKGFLHRPIESAADLDALYEEMRALPPQSLYVYRVSREMALRGRMGGMASAMLLADMPKNVHGYVMLSFDGWADDPRELFQVPEVVEFCQGLLFGIDPQVPDLKIARHVLPVLLNEDSLSRKAGPQAFDAAGRFWVVGTAHPEAVYRRARRSPSGWTRDVGVVAGLLNLLLPA